jgi:hypothetical protein
MTLLRWYLHFRLAEAKKYQQGVAGAYDIMFTASDSHNVHLKAMQICTKYNSNAYLTTY